MLKNFAVNARKTLVPCTAILFHLNVASAATNEIERTTNKEEVIGVYLKPESKKLIAEFLRKRGLGGKTVDYVAMYSAAEENDSYIFRPLFGERAAFRLTGLLTLEDGTMVGMGRLSNMIGEIQIDEREVCIPIFSNNESSRICDDSTKKLLDAPTLFSMGVPGGKEKFQWRGRIPANRVGKVHYPALRGQYVRIPQAEQVVVDGYICSNKYCSADGQCEYDRSLEIEHSLVSKESQAGGVKVATIPNSVESESVQRDSPDVIKETCPVCRYMKAGPCKDQFIQWDNCIKLLQENQELRDCFVATKTMMYCMKDFEYYDIMTAGTDYQKLDLASSTTSK